MQTIALLGNPNSGKTTLFNALSSSHAAVGNYPGMTVEQRRAKGTGPQGREIEWVDLPGMYSLQSRSPEEEITLKVLLGQVGGYTVPACWLYVLDATQVRRGLLLLRQLLDFQRPIVVALTYVDKLPPAEAMALKQQLSQQLGIEVVPIHNWSQATLLPLLTACKQAQQAKPSPPPMPILPASMQQAIASLQATMGPQANLGFAIWLLSSRLERTSLTIPPHWRQLSLTLQQDVERTGPSFGQAITIARYRQIDQWLQAPAAQSPATSNAQPRWTDRLDRWLLHPLWGSVVFASMMLVLFQLVFSVAEPTTNLVELAIEQLQTWLLAYLPAGQFRALLLEGLLPGLGTIAIFLPQIAVLFTGILLLEESGYLSRAAVLMDRWMGLVGLPGKAFVPLLGSFACAVPGIMATRTLERKQDRFTTIFIAPFMSCSARLPVYTLVIGALFAQQPPLFGIFSVGGVLMLLMYGLGMTAAWITAWLLRRHLWRAPKAPLLLALPDYQWPSPSLLGRHVIERCRLFLQDTAPVILTISLLLWGLLSYPKVPLEQAHQWLGEPHAAAIAGESQLAEEQLVQAQLHYSFAGRLGHLLEPIIAPLGFDWRIGIGLIASFAAREVLIGTLGQIYALGSKVSPDAPMLHAALTTSDGGQQQPALTPLVGLSLMVFFVLAMQCMSTFAVVRRETGTWSWPIGQLVYMNSLAYGASFLVYQLGSAWGWQ